MMWRNNTSLYTPGRPTHKLQFTNEQFSRSNLFPSHSVDSAVQWHLRIWVDSWYARWIPAWLRLAIFWIVWPFFLTHLNLHSQALPGNHVMSAKFSKADYQSHRERCWWGDKAKSRIGKASLQNALPIGRREKYCWQTACLHGFSPRLCQLIDRIMEAIEGVPTYLSSSRDFGLLFMMRILAACSILAINCPIGFQIRKEWYLKWLQLVGWGLATIFGDTKYMNVIPVY